MQSSVILVLHNNPFRKKKKNYTVLPSPASFLLYLPLPPTVNLAKKSERLRGASHQHATQSALEDAVTPLLTGSHIPVTTITDALPLCGVHICIGHYPVSNVSVSKASAFCSICSPAERQVVPVERDGFENQQTVADCIQQQDELDVEETAVGGIILDTLTLEPSLLLTSCTALAIPSHL
ncbi:hypothetical protein STEG23_028710 [Scotinomys teguina]